MSNGPSANPSNLEVGDITEITLNVINNSFNPATGPVAAKLNAGKNLYDILARSAGAGIDLPNTLRYVDPGTASGCIEPLLVPGVVCFEDPGDINRVIVQLNVDIPLGPGSFNPLAIFPAVAINPVGLIIDPTGAGEFRNRGEADNDVLTITDPSCNQENAGGFGETTLFFAPICGDGIVGNTTGETCDPQNQCESTGRCSLNPGEACLIDDDCPDFLSGEVCNPLPCDTSADCPVGDSCVQNLPDDINECRDDCTYCGDGILNGPTDPQDPLFEACDYNDPLAPDNCTTICTLLPTIVTTPVPEEGIIGVVLNDTAELSGAFEPATGTITFNLYPPTDPVCTGAPVFTQTVPVNGNGSYSTTTGHTTTMTGTYHWTASYSGDANNEPADSLCEDEPVVVFEPLIEIIKTPDPTVTKEGHDIVYTYTINNISSPETPDLILDSVIDDVVGDLTATAAANGCDPLVTPGGSCTFTASYTVQAGDPDPLVNTVEAHYHPDGFADDVSAQAWKSPVMIRRQV
jgi:hypothetical protein